MARSEPDDARSIRSLLYGHGALLFAELAEHASLSDYDAPEEDWNDVFTPTPG